MRSMFLILSACTAVANAAECQATEEATLLQLQRVRGQQKNIKVEAKNTDAEGLVKSLTHIAHNLQNMNTNEVNDALAAAAAALATLSPAIQAQVEYLQATLNDGAAAVEACHNAAGIAQRAALWTAAEEHSAASVTCDAELEIAIADEASICALIADVQSECACNEARARLEDKEELCAALKTAYELAYCEHNLLCTAYHDCHESETVVYNQIKADVEGEMGPIEDEYRAAQQSTCIMDIIQNAMLNGIDIDFDAIGACQTVDTSPLLVVYPVLPGTPAACPAASTGNPVCGGCVATETKGNDGSGTLTGGGPDGASQIQFVDLGAGAFQAAGEISSIRYHVSRANQAAQKFQIYRLVSGNTYNLVSETEALASTVEGSIVTQELQTPLQFQAGDYIGWVHTGQGTFPYRGGGGSVRWKYGIEAVGNNINFNGAQARIYGYEVTYTGACTIDCSSAPRHEGQYLWYHAAGDSTQRELQESMQRCVELGDDCMGITCDTRTNDLCTVREGRGGNLRNGPSQETSIVKAECSM